MENTTEYPIKYHCTVIQEEITAHSIKEFADKLYKLGFNDNSAINIKADIYGIVKERKIEMKKKNATSPPQA